jgi:hypothetical protein
MARLNVAIMQRAEGGVMKTFTLSVDYNANNGHVNGLFVSNGLSVPVHAQAEFDAPVGGQKVYGQDFGSGDTLMSLPANLLSVVSINKGDETVLGLSPECAVSLATI